MKTKLGILILAILVLATTFSRAQTNDLTSLLQQGLLEEQANRNLDAAIADYQTLAAQFDKNRQIAATAIFRLGECYRMLGKTNEAAAQYQRVLKDFSDQQTLATLSQQNLTGMGMSNPETVQTENHDIALWNRLKVLPKDELERILPTLAPDATLVSLLQQRNEAQAKLAELSEDFAPANPSVVKQNTLLAILNKQISDRTEGILAGLKMRAELSQPHFQERLQSIIARNPQDSAAETTDEESQEIQRIQTMIQNSPDLINAPSGGVGQYFTPLEKAASAGWLKVATYLLDHGAKVGDVALNNATKAGNRAMVELLLNRGADVNWNFNGLTPLHIAAQSGFQAVAEVLLANKADVNALDNQGNTPLRLATLQGQAKIIKMLLAAGANPNIPNKTGKTPLSAVADRRSPEITKLLLDAGANPNVENDDGQTPLSFAAGSGSPETVKLLLDTKADPNGGKLDAPLLMAIQAKDTNSAELLLQAGANPNAKGAVDWAVAGNVSAVQFVNNPNRYSLTMPLYLAISTKQVPMVQLLLKFKADPNDSQTDNRSLLFSALSDTNILEALLDAGANVDARDSAAKTDDNRPLNRTPLLYAVQSKSDADSVVLLLKHGANPNVHDSDGNTPLHLAAYNVPGKNVFQWLLDSKADPNVRSNRGETPLDILKRVSVGNYGTISPEQKFLAVQLADLLRQHGALDKLPDWDAITVSRPAANFSFAILHKETNDWNQFTLLEAILNFYESSQSYSVPQGNNTFAGYSLNSMLPFPDLTRVVILRPRHDSTNETRIVVNLLNGTNGIDCTKDVPLEFGDVVEIPEREHSLGENASGLTSAQLHTLDDYVKGSAKLIAHGQTVELSFYRLGNQAALGVVLKQPASQKALLSSSDLSRVKVIRHDVKTGKSREWILDCRQPEPSANGVVLTTPISYQWMIGSNNSSPSTDLWLRDGDVIEVPEK